MDVVDSDVVDTADVVDVDARDVMDCGCKSCDGHDYDRQV